MSCCLICRNVIPAGNKMICNSCLKEAERRDIELIALKEEKDKERYKCKYCGVGGTPTCMECWETAHWVRITLEKPNGEKLLKKIIKRVKKENC